MLALAAGTATALATTSAPSHGKSVVCQGSPAKIHRLDITVAGERTFGFYAVPQSRPKGIVVFAHGYSHTAWSWVEHAKQVAARDGVIAVAMDYRGQKDIRPAKGETLPTSPAPHSLVERA